MVKPLHLLIPLTLATLTWMTPAQAETEFETIRRTAPQSQLQFAPYTVGSVIFGATDRLYSLDVQKGQILNITVNSTGARAAVMVFDPKGSRLITLTDRSEPFEYVLPQSGRYYVFCYGGPTYHFYDLVVRVL